MKHITNWKYPAFVVGALAGMTLLASRIPFAHVTGQAAMLSALVLTVAGIIAGTVGFIVLRQAVEATSVRMVCAFTSAAGGAGVGFVLGFSVIRRIWDALVFDPHPSYHGGNYVYGFLGLTSIVLTALVSAVFGAGIGLPLGRHGENG